MKTEVNYRKRIPISSECLNETYTFYLDHNATLNYDEFFVYITNRASLIKQKGFSCETAISIIIECDELQRKLTTPEHFYQIKGLIIDYISELYK